MSFDAVVRLFSGPLSRPPPFFCSSGRGMIAACSGGISESSSDSGTDASDGSADGSIGFEASPPEAAVDAPASYDGFARRAASSSGAKDATEDTLDAGSAAPCFDARRLRRRPVGRAD